MMRRTSASMRARTGATLSGLGAWLKYSDPRMKCSVLSVTKNCKRRRDRAFQHVEHAGFALLVERVTSECPRPPLRAQTPGLGITHQRREATVDGHFRAVKPGVETREGHVVPASHFSFWRVACRSILAWLGTRKRRRARALVHCGGRVRQRDANLPKGLGDARVFRLNPPDHGAGEQDKTDKPCPQRQAEEGHACVTHAFRVFIPFLRWRAIRFSRDECAGHLLHPQGGEPVQIRRTRLCAGAVQIARP